MTLWVRTQSGSLVNLDNCVTVCKRHGRVPTGGDVKQCYKVVVFDSSPEGTYLLANGLTAEQADTLLHTLWRAIPAEDSFDVQAVVK